MFSRLLDRADDAVYGNGGKVEEEQIGGQRHRNEGFHDGHVRFEILG